MKSISLVPTVLTLRAKLVASQSAFTYDDQGVWKDIPFQPPVANDCAKLANSPIDIPQTVAASCIPNQVGIDLDSGDCTLDDLKFSTNDHGVKAEFVGNCTKPTAKFPNYPETFVAAQFHVHTGCEHAIDGEGCDAELHIVHFSEDTDFNDFSTYKAAVIGIMLDNDALEPHSGFDGLLNCWAKKHNDFVESCSPIIGTCDVSRMFTEEGAQCSAASFDAYSLIPADSGYYNYMGGLTTPPCSQIVRWNLIDKKVNISLKQWSTLAQLILGYGGVLDSSGQCKLEYSVASKTGSTSRERQALGGRTITHRCSV